MVKTDLDNLERRALEVKGGPEEGNRVANLEGRVGTRRDGYGGETKAAGSEERKKKE